MTVERLNPYFLSLLIHIIFLSLFFLLIPKTERVITIPIDFTYSNSNPVERSVPKDEIIQRKEVIKKIETKVNSVQNKSLSNITVSKSINEENTYIRDESVDDVFSSNVSDLSANIAETNKTVKTVVENPINSESVSRSNFNKQEIILAFMRKVEQFKYYPYLARRKGIEGVVVVFVHLNKNGEALSINIKSSSGYEILDRSAIELIRKVCPFKHELNAELKIEVPIIYKLNM